MNLLTKSLLEDLLDTQKTVAIYGGGFKPPTKGHFNVAELALSTVPSAPTARELRSVPSAT